MLVLHLDLEATGHWPELVPWPQPSMTEAGRWRGALRSQVRTNHLPHIKTHVGQGRPKPPGEENLSSQEGQHIQARPDLMARGVMERGHPWGSLRGARTLEKVPRRGRRKGAWLAGMRSRG